MPFVNLLYTRTWTKMFAPISTLITQLGKQFSLQTILNKTNHNDLLINMDSLSTDNNETNSSNNPLLEFFSNLISSFRPYPLSKSSYDKYSHQSHTKLSKYSEDYRNDYLKHEQINLISENDENNNQKSNSIILNLPIQTIDEYNEKYIFTTEHFLWIFILTIIYFIWFIFIVGISLIHLIIYLIIIILYLISDRTRRFTLAIFIYLIYLLLYDALHLIPNYTISNVHIEDVYLIEKKFFGIIKNEQLLTLNEYFKLNHIPFLDVFTGICYLNWIPIPIAYSFYLYRYKNKRDYIDFAFTFLLTNILGFIIYYIVPAAPPWYIELYGFNMNIKTPGSPGGFKNFDRITGIKIFSLMYSKNANVFAALPSLHAAYPVITVLYGSLSKKLWLHIGFVCFTLCVWFSAIYSRHHYVLDVLAGGTCAVTAYILYRLLCRIPPINRLLVAYSKLI